MNIDFSDSKSFLEAEKIIDVAQKKGATLRLIGGMAIRFHCHGPHSTHLRFYHDVDMFGLTKQLKAIYSVLDEFGYSPNVLYNTKTGGTRLQFVRKPNGEHIDIFLDKFRMDHTLDFRKRLQLDSVTIPVTDLLLTKLQIVRITDKDVRDVIAILEDHEVTSENFKEVLELNYLSKLCSDDWGLEKTVLDNIDKIGVSIDKHEFVLPNDKEQLREKLNHLHEAIRKKRKGIRWRLRDLIGTRMKWYSVIEMGEGEA